MKNFSLSFMVLCLLTSMAFGSCSTCAGHTPGAHSHNHSNSHNHSLHSGSSSSDSVRLINTEYQKTEHNFPNCDEHYIVTETTTNIYSDGSRRTISNSSIYNKDGTVIETDCKSVEHIIYQNKHYFIVNKNGYKLLSASGEVLTKRKYSGMTKISPNRILVKYEKRYGIIDIDEKTIVPIKYQKMTRTEDGVFITKLNRYYGILDENNNVLLKNECEMIKQIHDVLLVKRYGKYGLYSLDGKVIYGIDYDKIRKYNEYILLKSNDRYMVADFYGNKLSDLKYDKIKLDRNNLQGLYNNHWENIED